MSIKDFQSAHRLSLTRTYNYPQIQIYVSCLDITNTMGSYETTPDQSRRQYLSSTLRPIITDFLDALEYKPPPKPDAESLRDGMLRYAASSGVPYDGDMHAHQCFMTGLAVAGVSELPISYTPPGRRSCGASDLHAAWMRPPLPS